MNHEEAGDGRSMIVRGVVEQSYDDGEMQLVDVRTHDGILRTGIEVIQTYGMAHNPPVGSIAVLMAVGGDTGDYMALPSGNPSARMGGLAQGEAGIYRWPDGTRIMLRGGGVIEVLAATRVTISTGDVEVTAPIGVTITTPTATINGDLKVTGQVSDATGTMQTMRDQYNEHVNGSTPPPTPQMT